MKTPQKVVISLRAPQGLAHLQEEVSVTTTGKKPHVKGWDMENSKTDLLKEHGFSAGAVLADLGHAVLLPHDFGFLLQKCPEQM